MLDIVQHVDHVRTAYARGVIYAGVGVRRVLAQLRGAFLRGILHVFFAAEVETAGRTRLHTGWLEARAHTVGAQRTLMDLLSDRIEFRNIERATSHAILAADAIILLKIHDPVGVLDDGAIRGTRAQATGV